MFTFTFKRFEIIQLGKSMIKHFETIIVKVNDYCYGETFLLWCKTNIFMCKQKSVTSIEESICEHKSRKRGNANTVGSR